MPNEEPNTAPELPPLEITSADENRALALSHEHSVDIPYQQKEIDPWEGWACRDRQLSAARRENLELRTQLQAKDESKGTPTRCIWCGWTTIPPQSKEHYEKEVWPSITAHISKDCKDTPHVRMAALIVELVDKLQAIREQVAQPEALCGDYGHPYYDASAIDPIFDKIRAILDSGKTPSGADA